MKEKKYVKTFNKTNSRWTTSKYRYICFIIIYNAISDSMFYNNF